LRNRASDSAEQIARRIADSRIEIARAPEFDYIVVNDDFATAIDDLRSIFCARRLRCDAQMRRQAGLLEDLLRSA
jgi:guanylate kinase